MFRLARAFAFRYPTGVMSPQEIFELRKTVFNAFDPQSETPIDDHSEQYIDIYPANDDPIVKMHDEVRFNGAGKFQLISGCRGSGKSTQLNRLARRLKDDRYTVLTVDALEYINPSEPVSPSDLIIMLAAAVSQNVIDELGADPTHQGFLSRFWDTLNLTDVGFSEFGMTIGAGKLPAEIAKLEAGFKLNFRTNDSFREKIRKHLSARITTLKEAARAFFEQIADRLNTKQPGRKGFVLILDQFEQIRGDVTNAQQVIESVLRIFTQHDDILPMPGWHIIYTVPPWLHLAHPRSEGLNFFIPCLKLWQTPVQGQPRQRDEGGWEKMRDLIQRRAGHENMSILFGEEDASGTRPIVEKMIEFSGGHFRDLFLIISRCVLSARDLPIEDAHVTSAIGSLAQSMSVSEADSLILREVHRTHEDCRPDREAATTMNYALLLDGHLILEFRNGEAWFDVHPAIVKIVERIAARVEERQKAAAAPATPAP